MRAAARAKFGGSRDATPLEPVRIEDLRRGPSVERSKPTQQRVVQPVVRIDQVQVVPWPQNPTKARLPADHGTLGIVLYVVDERDEGVELRLADEAVESRRDRKSTRLNSSHGYISYAVFCLQ